MAKLIISCDEKWPVFDLEVPVIHHKDLSQVRKTEPKKKYVDFSVEGGEEGQLKMNEQKNKKMQMKLKMRSKQELKISKKVEERRDEESKKIYDVGQG